MLNKTDTGVYFHETVERTELAQRFAEFKGLSPDTDPAEELIGAISNAKQELENRFHRSI